MATIDRKNTPNETWTSIVVTRADGTFVGYINIPNDSLKDPTDLSKLTEFLGSGDVVLALATTQERTPQF